MTRERHRTLDGTRDDAEVTPIDPDLVDVAVPSAPPERRFSVGPANPRLLLAVAAGGAIGGPARYGVSQWIATPAGGFPWATLWINLSGSLLLGFVVIFLLERFRPSPYLRAFLGTGFCGAYTTFSTFAVETDMLVRDTRYTTAGLYVIASIAGGLVAVWAGMRLARLLPHHPAHPQHAWRSA